MQSSLVCKFIGSVNSVNLNLSCLPAVGRQSVTTYRLQIAARCTAFANSDMSEHTLVIHVCGMKPEAKRVLQIGLGIGIPKELLHMQALELPFIHAGWGWMTRHNCMSVCAAARPSQHSKEPFPQKHSTHQFSSIPAG